ncbi:MAG TPA: response regulator [Polyangium sp.]|nr:response regulator [Polyangium sp.]
MSTSSATAPRDAADLDASASEEPILIVDDNAASLDVLFNLLGSAGFELAAAVTGEMALELIARDAPALILLDVQLPGIDGYEVCRRIKADAATSRIPVIFMTAQTDVENRLRGLSLGAVDYVTKPFQQEELLARVRAQMEIHRLSKRLVNESGVRAVTEVALAAISRDFERRVEERTADLGRALTQIEQTKTQLAETNEELRKANQALLQEAAKREQALDELRLRLADELAERERTEEQRAALQEQIIAFQKAAIAELSTPLIPISAHVVVIPMIGMMNEERAEQLLDSALRGVQARGASVVIIDVTGLKSIDGSVIDSFVRTANALQLLGARAIITGIRADFAQAIIESGADLTRIATRSTLESAIAHALGASFAKSSAPRAR